MIILRQRLYGKNNDDIVVIKKKDIPGLALVAAVPVINKNGIPPIADRVIEKAEKDTKVKSDLIEENSKLLEKLKKKSDVKIQSKEEAIEEELKRLIEKKKKSGETPDIEKLRRNATRILKNHPNHYNTEKDIIRLSNENAATLAHELGHSKYNKKYKREGGMGKLVHSLDTGRIELDRKIKNVVDKNIENKGTRHDIKGALSKTQPIASGFISGYVAGRKEEKGEDVGVGNKLVPGLTTLAYKGPVLGREIAASRRGYKELKSLGASKRYLKNAKKGYRSAIGTYAMASVPHLLTGYGSREVGKFVGKSIERTKKKRDKE